MTTRCQHSLSAVGKQAERKPSGSSSVQNRVTYLCARTRNSPASWSRAANLPGLATDNWTCVTALVMTCGSSCFTCFLRLFMAFLCVPLLSHAILICVLRSESGSAGCPVLNREREQISRYCVHSLLPSPTYNAEQVLEYCIARPLILNPC